MDFVEKWKYKLSGRTIPVIQVKNVEDGGKIHTLVLSSWVDRPNHVYEDWNVIGAEKDPNVGLIELTMDGVTKMAYAEFKGKTCCLYTDQQKGQPNHEKTIGVLTSLDKLAEILDLAESMRLRFIYLGMGILLGWWIVAPMVKGIFS